MLKRQWIIVALVAGLAIITALLVRSVPTFARDAGPAAVLGTPSPTLDAPRPATALHSPSNVITATSAADIAAAMGIQAGDLVSASLSGSDPRGAGIAANPVGKHFPTQGDTFVILSTGLVESAEWPNHEEDLSFELDGLFNVEGNDLVQLWLQLRVPEGRNCANVDFTFYSEEYPEWVDSEFNDTFTAELGGTNIVISGSEVTAPLNFAFDTEGNIMSVNSVFGFVAETGTTYDGGTSLLRAQTPVVPGSVIDVVFSVQDLGDSILDSAVFLDKFFWSAGAGCGSGAQEDTDGDGLLDKWETDGVTVRVDGADVFVDLPAMGANPLHKDIFVEVDYMAAEPGCLPFIDYCFSGHTHEPKYEAMQRIIYSFFLAPVPNPDGKDGINLHVDYGPRGIMNPVTLEQWGSRSSSNALRHDEVLGAGGVGGYKWSEFKAIKKANFSKAREPFFHYAVFAHILGGPSPGTSGLSRGIGASDFIVTLGKWDQGTGTVTDQAGTFMHELGHNLGLRHSGRTDLLDTNFKPNYLSVMNYAFQTRGLRVGSKDFFFDYSRWELPTLDEDSLDETVGLQVAPALSDYGTRYWCAMNDEEIVNSVSAIDWNCDGTANDVDVKENINEGPDWRHDTRTSKLRSYADWDNLVFTGGAIGQPGAEPVLTDETEINEITFEQDATLTTDYGVSVGSAGDLQFLTGNTAVYTFTITSLGINTDTYTVTATSSLGWGSLGTVPASVTLQGGGYAEVAIKVNLPQVPTPGSVETLLLNAASQTNPRAEDQHSVDIYVPVRIFLPLVIRN